MNARLERVLIQLARQHASHLIAPGWDAQDDYEKCLRQLARRLADYNFLVIMGVVPSGLMMNRALHIQRWITEYGRLYRLLAGKLFPTFATVSARYADPRIPPIVVIHGGARPVIQVMAGFMLPYIALRQKEIIISELELRGLMDMVLDELEAGLPYEEHRQLRKEGADILQGILSMQIRQLALMDFDRVLFYKNRRPSTLPEEQQLPNTGYLLPLLEDEPEETTPTEELFSTPIPMFFERKQDDTSPRRPPVHDLPND